MSHPPAWTRPSDGPPALIRANKHIEERFIQLAIRFGHGASPTSSSGILVNKNNLEPPFSKKPPFSKN